MKRNITITLFFCLSLLSKAEQLDDFLFPEPQQIKLEKGFLNQVNENQYSIEDFTWLIEKLYDLNIDGSIKSFSSPLVINTLNLSVDTTLQHHQEYHLTIDSTSINITGKDEAALFYGKQTLKQIISYHISTKQPIPCLTISDWPDFERRGYMLDISRDKVPTMETLYHMIDLLASWKINEFQLYTEHTFAYKNHELVWQNSSPMTAEEIKMLDIYCKSRFIDLVPNQNSFGHMENWLQHDQYVDLAECPTDCKTIWGTRSRHSLNPINPGSLQLMQELYAELLPNFTSKYFNIGCDETVELGCGLSAEYCKEKGKGNVYLEYLIKLNNEVNKYGSQAQFWGDIILNHPELISSIPKNMTAMVWGYESTYPFHENLPKFKQAGLDFYVCPGTSTWRSIIGRNHDAFINLKQAAINGKLYGAKGYLNTNWGDYGHWQALSVCYPAMAVGSAYSWNSNSNPTTQLENVLNHYVFNDKTGNTAKAVLELSNAYLACKIPEGNANAFHLMLHRYKWTMKGHYQTKMLKIDPLLNAEKIINHASQTLNKAKPACADSSIVINELKQAIALAKHGIHLGVARLNAHNFSTENIPEDTKQQLKDELATIISSHEYLWTVRNRKGGLASSSQKLKDLLDYYDK
jgi:hypothetical protein